MILSGPIRPAQLKTFHGIIDFYYDRHGRVIARSWPRASTKPNPGMMATAARMTVAHTLRRAAHPSWKPSWAFRPLPQGRTAFDLAQQNILWQLAATENPILCAITDLGHDWSDWEEKHIIWFRTEPSWETIRDKIELWVWSLESGVSLAPTVSYSHMLFRRGDATLRRPIIDFPQPRLKTLGDGPFYGDWWTIDLQDDPNSNYSVTVRPMWRSSILPPAAPPPSLCYAPAPRPLPAGGLWTVGPYVSGSLPY